MVLGLNGGDLKNSHAVIGGSKGRPDISAELYLDAHFDDTANFEVLRRLEKGQVIEVRGLLHQAGKEDGPLHLRDAKVAKIDGEVPGTGKSAAK